MVTLTRCDGSNVYFVGGADATTARFAAVADPDGSLPDCIPLDQTWGDWRYLFFERGQAAAFAAQGKAVWSQLSGTENRVAWFSNPGSIVSGATLKVDAGAAIGAQLLQRAVFAFRNYTLEVPLGARLSIADTGFHLDLRDAGRIGRWTCGAAAVNIDGFDLSLDVVDGNRHVSCFRCQFKLASGTPPTPDVFDTHDVGLRFFRNAFAGECLPGGPVPNPTRIVTRRFRLFGAPQDAPVPVTGYFDLFEPTSAFPSVNNSPPATRIEFQTDKPGQLLPENHP